MSREFAMSGAKFAMKARPANLCLSVLAALTFSTTLVGQTCTVTSPTASQLIQTVGPLSLTLAPSNSPTAYRAVWTVDYWRWAQGFKTDQHQAPVDSSEAWTGTPFAVTWYPGLNGDGAHTVSAIVYDIFGAQLATCSQSFTVRLEGMSNQTINALPTSGIGEFGVLSKAPGAHFMLDGLDGSNSSIYGDPLFHFCGLDGGTSQTGGWKIPNLVTTCWPNGQHLIVAGANVSSVARDPYVVSQTFTSSNVSGNYVTVTNHSLQNSNAVVFSSTGTLPTPLVPGKQFFWTTSPTNPSNTATVSFARGVATVTCSSACGATSGTPIYVFNIQYTNQSTGVNGCDGYYIATSGSGTSFTFNVSATCPNGIVVSGTAGAPPQITLSGTLPANSDVINLSGFTGAACSNNVGWTCFNGTHRVNLVPGTTTTYLVEGLTASGTMTGSPVFQIAPQTSNASPLGGNTNNVDLEVDVNPYFLQYVDVNTVSVSATPGGSTISLTNGGSGTHTIQSRTRSPYWTGPATAGYVMPADYVETGGPANLFQLATFSNGTKPMQIQAPYWEYHGWFSKSGDTVCPRGILNTDLTLTAAACSAFTYTLVPDGGLTGVVSVNSTTGAITYNNTSSWSNPVAQSGWVQVKVACATCGPGGIALPTVTVYVENHGNSSSSVTFPHHTTCGVLATSFTTGSCHSFYPISVWQANPVTTPTAGWLGPALTRANVNSILDSFTYTTNLINPAATSCPTWPDAEMTTLANFANTWNIYLEYDLFPIWFNLGNNTTSLAAILNNTGYNRRACLQSLVSYLIGLQRVWRFYNDDEVSDFLGNYLEPNPALGGANWTSASTTGGILTLNVVNITTQAAWNQSTGAGNAIQIQSATTNSCINGWHLLTTVSPTTLTTPAGTCPNGLTINSSSDPSAAMNLPFPAIPITGTTLLQNAGPLPGNLSATEQFWDSKLTSIVVNGTTGTLNWANSGVSVGQAIRLYCYACAHPNLNFIGPVTAVNSSTVTIQWTNLAGGIPPAAGTYNSSTDGSGFYITVDPNWGANPLGQFYSIVDAVPNHPIKAFSMLGALFGSTASVFSYDGNPTNTDSAWLYIPQPPNHYTGPDVSVNQMANYSQSSSGLSTRAFQLKPRTMLFYGGYIGGGNTVQNCQTFQFNPACDRPGQLDWRPETTLAQTMSMKTLDVVGLRLYNYLQDTSDAYNYICCGWNSRGNGGWGTGGGMSANTAPKTWTALAHASALLVMREDTELQPEANKPYLGPYFETDAHLSSTYGNETTVLCASEMPYGSVTIPLNAISGGTTLKYITDGYTTTVATVSGNPSSDTEEFCTSPGRTTVFVSQPPGYTALDTITFAPPSPLPFGASKFLIQAGYYPDDMRSDPVTDCSTGCAIGIDHHNINAWYRVIYADMNGLPRSIGQPVEILSQGLY